MTTRLTLATTTKTKNITLRDYQTLFAFEASIERENVSFERATVSLEKENVLSEVENELLDESFVVENVSFEKENVFLKAEKVSSGKYLIRATRTKLHV